MLQDLALAANTPFVDVPGLRFQKGFRLNDVSNECGGLLNEPGVCFGGFRHFPPTALGLNLTPFSRSVLLVRDPRDILVSHYFSMLKSHAVSEKGEVRERLLSAREEAGNVDIDSYVIEKAGFFVKQFVLYRSQLLGREEIPVKVFRYEEVIFEKARWLTEINEWFGWEVKDSVVEKIAKRHDLRPESENESQHVRKVTPGDHREKLKQETIGALTETFKDIVKPFGYVM